MKIKAIMIGDSGLYGANGTSRLSAYPQLTLNSSQNVFDFCYDYSIPGASWERLFSSNPAIRLSAGLPGGCTFEQLLQTTDASAILFGLGGNDYNNLNFIISGIREAARLCSLYGKACAFIVPAFANATQSYNYSNPAGTTFYNSGYMEIAAKLAGASETVRQTCIHEDLIFFDTQNRVPILDWSSITGDIVHPSQSYSTSIYKAIAEAIST